ncbi:MAG: hypothetical protein WDO72_13685 [Pseudomonadota bacterium]
MTNSQKFAASLRALAATIGLLGACLPAFAAEAPDVIGVRAGMSLDEAIGVVKRHDPKLDVYPRVGSSALLPGVVFSDGVNMRNFNQSENIDLMAAMEPNAKIVWGIRRGVVYAEEGRPTVTNIIAALRQKYGKEDGSLQQPASVQAAGVELLDAYWLFDDAGKRVSPTAAREYAQLCRQAHLPGQDPLALVSAGRASLLVPGGFHCDRWTFIQAQWQPTPAGAGMTPGLAFNMSITLANGALHGKTYAASVAMVENAARDRQNKEKRAAEAVRPVL